MWLDRGSWFRYLRVPVSQTLRAPRTWSDSGHTALLQREVSSQRGQASRFYALRSRSYAFATRLDDPLDAPVTLHIDCECPGILALLLDDYIDEVVLPHP